MTIEGDVRARGEKLLAEVRKQEAKGSPTEWFYDTLMALTTKDEKLKVELFRFVDALPALNPPSRSHGT